MQGQFCPCIFSRACCILQRALLGSIYCIVCENSEKEADMTDNRQIFRLSLYGIADAENDQNDENDISEAENRRKGCGDGCVDTAKEQIQKQNKKLCRQRIRCRENKEDQSLVCVIADKLRAACEENGNENENIEIAQNRHQMVIVAVSLCKTEGMVSVRYICFTAAARAAILCGPQRLFSKFALHVEYPFRWSRSVGIFGNSKFAVGQACERYGFRQMRCFFIL